MGSSSGSAHRGLGRWQGLLLVVSLLNFWSQTTIAHVKVLVKPVLEHTNAVLYLLDKPRDAVAFMWYHGENFDSNHSIAYLYKNSGSYVRGPPGGQVMVQDDGSLLLKNVTMEDAGVYTVLVQLQGCQKMIVCGRLNIYKPVSVPILRTSDTMVRENKDMVAMSCYTNQDDIKWLFKGESLVLTETMRLSPDLRTLTIDPVLKKDAGYYECKASNLLSSGTSARLYLNVTDE